MSQRPKALISARAKKFIPSQLFVTITFTSKAHNNLQGVFPALSPLATFCLGYHAKKVAKGDKANHGWENTL